MRKRWKWVIVLAVFGVLSTTAATCVWALNRVKPEIRARVSVERGLPSFDVAEWKRLVKRLGRAAPGMVRELRREASRRPYPLDILSRRSVRDGAGGIRCPDVELETYEGEVIAYRPAVKVYPEFRARLQRFDRIVERVALRIYGRAPDRVLHFGTYNCRTIRGKSRLSEHAFGNAIDVSGFAFDAVENADQSRYGRAFTVSLLQHWDSESGFAGQHSEFLKALARELDEDRVFRGMLMPPAAGHDDHFHLDMGRLIYMHGSAYRDG